MPTAQPLHSSLGIGPKTPHPCENPPDRCNPTNTTTDGDAPDSPNSLASEPPFRQSSRVSRGRLNQRIPSLDRTGPNRYGTLDEPIPINDNCQTNCTDQANLLQLRLGF